MNTTIVRPCGFVLLGGAMAWAVSAVITGPLYDDQLSRLELAGSLAFQVGLACLIGLLWMTGAAGAGRWARAVLSVETVLLSLAVGWTVVHVSAANPSMVDKGVLTALDSAWR